MQDMATTPTTIDSYNFNEGFDLFRGIIQTNDPGGREFVNFQQGVIHTDEGYKVRTHTTARKRLAADDWSLHEVGSGTILERTIHAIEVPGNNLLTWDDRNGPETRAHIGLVNAKAIKHQCRQTERLLFGLYKDDVEDSVLFEELIEITGRNYPLLGYLWFMKDIGRFTPLRPIGLQSGLKEIGINYRLSQKCSWENYSGFIDILQGVRKGLASKLAVGSVPLIDAHSFIWVLGGWLKPNAVSAANRDRSGKASSYGPEETAAWVLAESILKTVANSNGQIVERTVKDKTTDMRKEELIAYIAELIRSGGARCAISGLPLHLPGSGDDPDMKASPDRIDSDRGYVRGNIQIVCWFINRWKNNDSAENFARLLGRIRDTGKEFDSLT